MKSRKEIHYSAISLITLLERNKINFEQMPEILDRAKVLLQRNERKKIKTEVCHLQYRIEKCCNVASPKVINEYKSRLKILENKLKNKNNV